MRMQRAAVRVRGSVRTGGGARVVCARLCCVCAPVCALMSSVQCVARAAWALRPAAWCLLRTLLTVRCVCDRAPIERGCVCVDRESRERQSSSSDEAPWVLANGNACGGRVLEHLECR